MSAPLALDHVGIVVPDLDRAVPYYGGLFGYVQEWLQPFAEVDGSPLGLPGRTVKLRAAMLTAGPGTTGLELHEYRDPAGTGTHAVYETGIGHVAVRVLDIDAEIARLGGLGMTFHAPAQLIADGSLRGRRWVYGRDRWGVVWELCQHPDATATTTRA